MTQIGKEILLEQPSGIVRMLDSAEGKRLIKYLDWKYKARNKNLRTSVKVEDIYRNQGALDVLEELLTLRDFLVNYQKDVASGNVHEVKSR